ncbi:glycosyltransferase family 2 protein [Fructilactobacillus sp. Tb1]|uniref:glycosyltransferase family 2 protein n=1 Tax=Fructilactobacillus sp. Tb1 TaxID=3422304 RepID=UPI003D2C6537
MQNLDVSVILTTYNSEKTVERAFKSIINQKGNFNFEVVIVDDGSKDKTIDIIRLLAKNHTNVKIVLQKNSGLSAARNNGMINANGKYFMFSDDDDEYLPNYINQMLKYSVNTKLVVAGIKKQFPNGNIVEETKSIFENNKSNKQMIEKYLVDNHELDVGAWNKLYSSDVIKNNKLEFVNKTFFEDSLFILKYISVISFDEVSFIDHPYYLIHKRNGSITNSFEPKLFEKCEKFINDTAYVLNENGYKNKPKYFSSFKARTILFYVHRSILNDNNWTAYQQKKVLKKYLNFSTIYYLPLKYKVALILATLMPEKYIQFYKNKKW